MTQVKTLCFCGLVHGDYQSDEEALLSDAYHDIFQGALPDKEWREAVFELLSAIQQRTLCTCTMSDFTIKLGDQFSLCEFCGKPRH